MIRRIITIDSDKCDGCGLCVDACHEGAIGLQNGKAVLLRDDYCDGLGDCLPACPAGAISFEEREALPYDEAAVQANMAGKKGATLCPGSLAPAPCPGSHARMFEPAPGGRADAHSPSCLRQWPVQIKLAPVDAPWFSGADLLIAADCTAFAHGGFHRAFMHGKITLIGCPKLDAGDYTEKLAQIIGRNAIASVTVARMSVPCCGGIEQAVHGAVKKSGKNPPVNVVTIEPDGTVRAASPTPLHPL